jgi:hypothetical protein
VESEIERAYLTGNRDKLSEYAILSICGRGNGNRKALPDVVATAGHAPLASLLIKEAGAEDKASWHQVKEFGQKLRRERGYHDKP